MPYKETKSVHRSMSIQMQFGRPPTQNYLLDPFRHFRTFNIYQGFRSMVSKSISESFWWRHLSVRVGLDQRFVHLFWWSVFEFKPNIALKGAGRFTEALGWRRQLSAQQTEHQLPLVTAEVKCNSLISSQHPTEVQAQRSAKRAEEQHRKHTEKPHSSRTPANNKKLNLVLRGARRCRMLVALYNNDNVEATPPLSKKSYQTANMIADPKATTRGTPY